MTQRAGRRKPGVALASPVLQPPRGRHASSSSGPAARWMAPSTPLPPSSELLAALTMASTVSAVMSPHTASTRICRGWYRPGLALGPDWSNDHIVVITSVAASHGDHAARRALLRGGGR